MIGPGSVLIKIQETVPNVNGLSFNNDPYDKGQWRIDFTDEATAQQKADAKAVVDAFDIAAYEAAAVAETSRKENAKNDTEGMAFLDLMKSKTSAQRKDWLSSNVADPNVRKVLQGLMSIVLWKVA